MLHFVASCCILLSVFFFFEVLLRSVVLGPCVLHLVVFHLFRCILLFCFVVIVLCVFYPCLGICQRVVVPLWTETVLTVPSRVECFFCFFFFVIFFFLLLLFSFSYSVPFFSGQFPPEWSFFFFKLLYFLYFFFYFFLIFVLFCSFAFPFRFFYSSFLSLSFSFPVLFALLRTLFCFVIFCYFSGVSVDVQTTSIMDIYDVFLALFGCNPNFSRSPLWSCTWSWLPLRWSPGFKYPCRFFCFSKDTNCQECLL